MANKRKRKANPHGPDRGTPEQQMRRFMLVGPNPPELASYPLGIALARRIITLEEHNAGADYARLYRGVNHMVGRGRGYGREIDEAVLIEMEEQFNKLRSALIDAGRRAKEVVDSVAVWQRGLSTVEELEALRLGLRALAKACGVK